MCAGILVCGSRRSFPCCLWAVPLIWDQGSLWLPSAAPSHCRTPSPRASSAQHREMARSWASKTQTWTTSRLTLLLMWSHTHTLLHTHPVYSMSGSSVWDRCYILIFILILTLILLYGFFWLCAYVSKSVNRISLFCAQYGNSGGPLVNLVSRVWWLEWLWLWLWLVEFGWVK